MQLQHSDGSDFSDQYEYDSATDNFEYSEATADRLKTQRRKLYKIKYPHGAPGSKKYVKYLNDLLGDPNRAPLDEDELVSLLRDQYNPRSMFSLFFPGEGGCPPRDRLKLWAMWAPLLECTFEQQTIYLKAMGVLPLGDEDAESSSSSEEDDDAGADGLAAGVGGPDAASRKPKSTGRPLLRHHRRRHKPIYHITKPLRRVMKRQPDPFFVDEVENEILAYLRRGSDIVQAARDAALVRRREERAAQRAAAAPLPVALPLPLPLPPGPFKLAKPVGPPSLDEEDDDASDENDEDRPQPPARPVAISAAASSTAAAAVVCDASAAPLPTPPPPPPRRAREEVPRIPPLDFPPTDAFHRLLIHGVAQYYNLQSNVITTPEGLESIRITGYAHDVPHITVAEYLARLRAASTKHLQHRAGDMPNRLPAQRPAPPPAPAPPPRPGRPRFIPTVPAGLQAGGHKRA